METPKIIVLTPVRNEAWILDTFLSITSRFADHIVIADQHSTDGTPQMAKRHPKVILIENKDVEFSNISRQRLLIDTARKLFPGPRILLALDADELLTADSVGVEGWEVMKKQKSGTVFLFEKPDLIETCEQCVRYPDGPWPLGYYDDNKPHFGPVLGSIRIPTSDDAPRLVVRDIKFLHYGLARIRAQSAKFRFYAVQDNLHKLNPLYRRRWAYNLGRVMKGLKENAVPVPPEWFKGWLELGFNVRTVIDEKFPWQDVELLKIFHRYGEKRFWLDLVWDWNWMGCYEQAVKKGLLEETVSPPSGPPKLVYRGIGAIIDMAYNAWRRFNLR